MKKLLSTLFLMLLLVGCGSPSHENEAKPPKSNSSLRNENYQDVITLFEDAGFTNIEVEKIEDLITGWLTKDGSVESVSIGGDTDYSTYKWYSADSQVRISYHTFPEGQKQEEELKPEMVDYGYNKTNIGEFSFDIPDYWQNQDPYYYAETGDEVTMMNYSIDNSLGLTSFEDVVSVKDIFVKGFEASIEGFELISNEKVRIGDIETVKTVFTGCLDDINLDFECYSLFQPESKGLLIILMAQSEKSQYNHFGELENMIKSVGPKTEIPEEVQEEEANNELTVDETPEIEAELQEETKEEKPAEQKPSSLSGYVYYSSNDKSSYKNGNSGKYSYVADHPYYDSYIIVDFDEGYCYLFQEGDGSTSSDRVRIESGSLNDVLIITYHDGSDKWSYGLHFAWKNQPDHLVLQDNDGFEYDYYPTDLDKALELMNKKTIYNY